MPEFSKRSKNNLNSCDERLQILFNEVIKYFDCAVICGHRNEIDQNVAYSSGRSKLKWPLSKHNEYPSKAVDVVPYPIDWNDLNRFYFFNGFVMGLSKAMGISIRSGADWDSDTMVNDHSFIDLPHYELKE